MRPQLKVRAVSSSRHPHSSASVGIEHTQASVLVTTCRWVISLGAWYDTQYKVILMDRAKSHHGYLHFRANSQEGSQPLVPIY